MSESKLRVLCLHGYRQNGILFREKTGSFRKLMKKYADFEFVSAPLIPSVADEVRRDDARAWWFSKASDEFSSRDVTEIATGFDESVSSVVDFVKENGPFDGLFGFSQGASMCHLLLALEKAGKIQLNFKFAILCAGFLSLSSVHSSLLTYNFDIPSFHIYGESDDIVNSKRSIELASKFENSRCVTHEGGHCVPSMTKNKEQIKEFFDSLV
ncbi:unnamed protein product [Auanema sp. JU1783]|nr:unnamed protein product [Auanema sp. JU1783]